MKQARVLTDAEFRRVLAVVGIGRYPLRNRAALVLSHYAGLRVGEIAHLRMADIVSEGGKIADQLHLNPKFTKGGVGRTVFISAKLAKELAGYVASLSTLPARLCAPTAPFIQSQKGNAFSPNSLCQLFSGIYAQAGVKGASSHSGRRGFITKLAHAGVSSKVIMELAGHKHLSTTQKYIDVTDEHKRAAVELV